MNYNAVHGNGWAGILLRPGWTNHTVIGNNVSAAPDGIRSNAANCTIKDNFVYDNTARGIAVQGGQQYPDKQHSDPERNRWPCDSSRWMART